MFSAGSIECHAFDANFLFSYAPVNVVSELMLSIDLDEFYLIGIYVRRLDAFSCYVGELFYGPSFSLLRHTGSR